MNLNRRSTIIGLGTIVAGGGAALGSGAFSQAEAERSLEVNVIDDANLIAEEFVDVVIDPTEYGSVGVVGDNLVDVSGVNYNENLDESEEVDLGSDAVSLVAGDPTIGFGQSDTGDFDDLDPLLPNSTTEYNGLFLVINGEGSTTENFNVTFEYDDGGAEYDLDFEPEMEEETINSGTVTAVDTDLTTGDDSGSDGELTIRIEPEP